MFPRPPEQDHVPSVPRGRDVSPPMAVAAWRSRNLRAHLTGKAATLLCGLLQLCLHVVASRCRCHVADEFVISHLVLSYEDSVLAFWSEEVTLVG